MTRTIYVNLPVTDLAASTRFYEAIGCRMNEQFSDDQASSMVWTDEISFHLLTQKHFAEFSPRPIADAHASTQVLLALTMEGRDEIDAIVEAAGSTGGEADPREVMDLGWLYNRTFADPDGHIFEAVYLDQNAESAGE